MRPFSLATSLLLTCLPALAQAQIQPQADMPGANPQARGAYLVTLGNCDACHTVAGHPRFSGGVSLSTPFGSMSSPNLTPDKTTGIGNYTDDQFYHAMHDGIRNDGARLYPGQPYNWYTKVTKDDVLVIKAYLFSLPPVHAPRVPNHLIFPFNIRAGIAGWNALYFKPGTYVPDASKSPAWNRGAYIVQGLGHCGDCHTPKNTALAPIETQAFAGGKLDGWFAPNITTDPKEGIGTWSQAEIVAYLKEGAAAGKGVAFGPMAQTVHDSLSKLTDADLTAIATYIKTLPPKANYRPATQPQSDGQQAGLQVYLNACSSCHQPNGAGIGNAIPPLAKNGAVASEGPQNALSVIISGLPALASYGPMPAYATILTPQQIADVANYVRTAWGNTAPPTATAAMVTKLLPAHPGDLATTHWCMPAPPTALDRAIANPTLGIGPALQSITPDNAAETVDGIVAKLQTAGPLAQQADVVNRLTAAFCPVVAADPSLDVKSRLAALDHFSNVVYTALTRSED
jgi:mono/diheme cytochrome c family protein